MKTLVSLTFLMSVVWVSESCVHMQFNLPDYDCQIAGQNHEAATTTSTEVSATTSRSTRKPFSTRRPGNYNNYKFGPSLDFQKGSEGTSEEPKSIFKRSLTKKNHQKKVLFYSINNYPKGLSKEETLSTFSKAFGVWCMQAHIKCFYTDAEYDADVIIQFVKRYDWEENQISAHKLKSGYGPSYIYLNCEVTWSLSTDKSDKPNLLAAAIHEIGHIFGLPHSNNVDSVMFPILDNSKIKLSKEDVKQIKYLYENKETTTEIEEETSTHAEIFSTDEEIYLFEPNYIEIDETSATDYPDWYYPHYEDKK